MKRIHKKVLKEFNEGIIKENNEVTIKRLENFFKVDAAFLWAIWYRFGYPVGTRDFYRTSETDEEFAKFAKTNVTWFSVGFSPLLSSGMKLNEMTIRLIPHYGGSTSILVKYPRLEEYRYLSKNH